MISWKLLGAGLAMAVSRTLTGLRLPYGSGRTGSTRGRPRENPPTGDVDYRAPGTDHAAYRCVHVLHAPERSLQINALASVPLWDTESTRTPRLALIGLTGGHVVIMAERVPDIEEAPAGRRKRMSDEW